ncbi:CBS domain-containing protein [Pseudomonas cavernicola]|uniref:CBS domain-containing protein n=1 Tax=Pseudomonas cavernicola TaxID=2320866 RepID=A0A418XIR5_9PSED|nr:CBS domain-containing protein [Pseudomonas cavernicola]RJG12340.1 CBS domain-containing protein [Pseudomonas cavernicola]
MKTVAEILKSKSHSMIFSVSPTTSVLDAVTLMAEKGIGALVVLEGEQLVGIVSERDYARKVALLERSSFTAQVSEIMTAKVITVEPRQNSQQCMQLMTEGRLRHLPVMQDGKLIGLLSIGDLVKNIISEQESLIHHLEQYIRGE